MNRTLSNLLNDTYGYAPAIIVLLALAASVLVSFIVWLLVWIARSLIGMMA